MRERQCQPKPTEKKLTANEIYLPGSRQGGRTRFVELATAHEADLATEKGSREASKSLFLKIASTTRRAIYSSF